MYYYYEGFKYIEAVSTSYNHYGIGCLDSGPNCEFFVCPSKDIGKICIKHFHHPRKDLIKAHKHDISAIAVHSESKLVATASEKGTIISLISLRTFTVERKLRRGLEASEIFGITFNPDGQWLVCWGDSGTVHLFSIEAENKKNPLPKGTTVLKFIPYFKQEGSFAQGKLPATANSVSVAMTQDELAMGKSNRMFLVTNEGDYAEVVLQNTPGPFEINYRRLPMGKVQNDEI